MESNEKEIQRIQEQIASIRSEKEALEAVLFDTQTNLEASEIKKLQLEKDNQELIVKQEVLKGQLARVAKDIEALEERAGETKASLMQQMSVQEADYKQIISNLKKHMDETIRKLTEEKVMQLVMGEGKGKGEG